MQLFREYSSLWRLLIDNRHKLEYSVNRTRSQLTVQPIATSNEESKILGFYKGKSAKNAPKMRDFQNFPKARQKNIYMKQVPSPSILGIVGDKKGSPFLDLGIGSPIFFHPKTAICSDFGCKKIRLWTLKSKNVSISFGTHIISSSEIHKYINTNTLSLHFPSSKILPFLRSSSV